MRKFARVAGLLVLLVAPSASTDTVLYQTSFDTDTTDVPGTYSPFEFDPRGYAPGNPAITASTPSDSTAFTENGRLHIHRGLVGGGSSVPYSAPELILSAEDLLGDSVFPSVFSVAVELGGTSGNASSWGTEVKFDDGLHENITFGFHPGYTGGGSNYVCFEGCYPNATTNQFFMAADTMYSIEMTMRDLDGSYQIDLAVIDPATSIVYTDSVALAYPYRISNVGIARWGSGGGDALIDNLTITTSVPEPTTGLMLGLGLLGVAVRRRVPA